MAKEFDHNIDLCVAQDQVSMSESLNTPKEQNNSLQDLTFIPFWITQRKRSVFIDNQEHCYWLSTFHLYQVCKVTSLS